MSTPPSPSTIGIGLINLGTVGVFVFENGCTMQLKHAVNLLDFVYAAYATGVPVMLLSLALLVASISDRMTTHAGM